MQENKNFLANYHQIGIKLLHQFGWNLVYCLDFLVSRFWLSSYLFPPPASPPPPPPPLPLPLPPLQKNPHHPLFLPCIQMFTEQFLSNLVGWQRLLNATFCYQFGWPWPSFKVTVVWEIKHFCMSCKFCDLFGWNVVCCHKLLLKLFYMRKIQWGELCLNDFIIICVPLTLACVGTLVSRFVSDFICY